MPQTKKHLPRNGRIEAIYENLSKEWNTYLMALLIERSPKIGKMTFAQMKLVSLRAERGVSNGELDRCMEECIAMTEAEHGPDPMSIYDLARRLEDFRFVDEARAFTLGDLFGCPRCSSRDLRYIVYGIPPEAPVNRSVSIRGGPEIKPENLYCEGCGHRWHEGGLDAADE